MPAKIRLFSDFLNRLEREGARNHFTWLIGAGMSVSSGISLASEISQKIILFEYIASEKSERPWESESDEVINYDTDLDDFLTWSHELEQKDSGTFKQMCMDSIEWLKRVNGFGDISPESPELYPLLFQHFFQDRTMVHYFLTTLVSRIRGINLAHLGLAGLLKSHPKWGHTVFTTNFDDLLLSALFSLNHTARVFGDVLSDDKPLTNPNHPQIVHLHGRHTGYRLLNTKGQIARIDEKLKAGFIKHLENSI